MILVKIEACRLFVADQLRQIFAFWQVSHLRPGNESLITRRFGRTQVSIQRHKTFQISLKLARLLEKQISFRGEF